MLTRKKSVKSDENSAQKSERALNRKVFYCFSLQKTPQTKKMALNNPSHHSAYEKLRNEINYFEAHKFSVEEYEALRDPSPNRPKAEQLERLAIGGRIEKGRVHRFYGPLRAFRPLTSSRKVAAVMDLTKGDLEGVAFKPATKGGKGIDIIEVTRISRGKYQIHLIQMKAGDSPINLKSDSGKGRTAVCICEHLNLKDPDSIASIYVKAFQKAFKFTFEVVCSVWTSARVSKSARELFSENNIVVLSLQRIWPERVIAAAEKCKFLHILPNPSNRKSDDPFIHFGGPCELPATNEM